MGKLDQTIVRGKTDGGRFAAIALRIDGTKLFSEYGLEYIKKTAKILLTEAIAHGKKPEEMGKRIEEVTCKTVSKAAYICTLRELEKILDGDVDNLRRVFEEVMEGSGDQE